MFRAVFAAALALALAPLVNAQTPAPPDGYTDSQAYERYPPPRFLREPDREPSSFYGSAGFAWSGELGVELEFGAQSQVGDFLQLRFSPFNFSIFGGDERYQYRDRYQDGSYSSYNYYADDCADDLDDDFSFAYFCYHEPDSEWRSVAEATLKLARGLYIGGGAAYLMQGEFDPEHGRTAGFLTLASQVDRDSALELRIGEDYSALRLVGEW